MIGDITQLLYDQATLNDEANSQLYNAVYDELHSIAHRQLRSSWGVETINTTGLVSEVYIKLANSKLNQAQNRNHFFAIAATAMRQIIINYAEQKNSMKRGKDWKPLSDSNFEPSVQLELDTLILINEALSKLSNIDKGLTQLVELKFFAGLTEEEIAKVYGVSSRTIRRNWTKAKLILANSLKQ